MRTKQLSINTESPGVGMLMVIITYFDIAIEAYYEDHSKMFGIFEHNLERATDILRDSISGPNNQPTDKLKVLSRDKMFSTMDGPVLLQIVGYVQPSVTDTAIATIIDSLLEMLEL